MTPVAICFYDPQGFFTIPEVSIRRSCPQLCKDTYEESYITVLFPDGSESSDLTAYASLVPTAPSYVWWTEETAGPYLTALTKVPYPPERYTNLKERWLESVAEYAGYSKHIGKIKDRIEMDLEYLSSYGPVESEYGNSWRHDFIFEKVNKMSWWTGAQWDIIGGSERRVKATVKKHTYVRGEAITELARVSPLKGEPPLVIKEAKDDRDRE